MIIIKDLTKCEHIYVSNPFESKPEGMWSVSIYDMMDSIVKTFLVTDECEDREYIVFTTSTIADMEDGDYVLKLNNKDFDIITRLRIGEISHNGQMTSGNTYNYNTDNEDTFYEG